MNRTQPAPRRITAAKAVRRAPAPPQPRVERLVGDQLIEVPMDCCATVLLKLVARDTSHRYYAWWLAVGRHDLDTISVPYKHTGEDVIRFDIPIGLELSSDVLRPHLTAYSAQDGLEEPDPPIIIGNPPKKPN